MKCSLVYNILQQSNIVYNCYRLSYNSYIFDNNVIHRKTNIKDNFIAYRNILITEYTSNSHKNIISHVQKQTFQTAQLQQ